VPSGAGRGGRGIAYAAGWTAATLVLSAALVYFGLTSRSGVREEIPQAELKAGLGKRTFDPNNPPAFTVERAELVLSDKDGKPKLRLETDRIVGENQVLSVREVTARFALEKEDELVIEARDCKYFLEGKEAVIEGDVRGSVAARGQAFSARKLSWSEESAAIKAHDVVMTDPQFTTRGDSMTIDLESGKIDLTGGVTLDI